MTETTEVLKAAREHTKGPWQITSISQDTGNIGVGCKEQRILIADVTNAASFGDMIAGAMRRGGGSFANADCHTQMANAMLIAAAPDLLYVAELVVSWLDEEEGAHALCDKARAAIRKATGGAA